MPNLNPVPDCPAHLAPELEAIKRDAVVRVHPYGALTVGEQGEVLADLAGLAPHVVAFSDDGRGVQSESMMRQAMLEAKAPGQGGGGALRRQPLAAGRVHSRRRLRPAPWSPGDLLRK